VDKYYLSHWEALSTEPPRPASELAPRRASRTSFTQMPVTRTTKVEQLRYMTDPLPHDVTVAGPITLTLHAAIDQDDTNWIVVLKDVGPDVSVRTAREGDGMSASLPERELTRGWLKASYRRSTKSVQSPGSRSTSSRRMQSLREAGRSGRVSDTDPRHGESIQGGAPDLSRLTSMDVPTGTGAMTNVEYIPYHVCSSKTVTHWIYRDAERPSHLLLPIIPNPTAGVRPDLCT